MKQEEHLQQKAFFNWMDLHKVNYPQLKWFFAIPNGGKRSKGVAGKMKAEGQKRGVLDTFLPVASKGYLGLWIEFKSERGVLTKEQKDWREYLLLNGYQVHVCRDWLEAAKATISYLDLKIKI